MTLPQQPRYFPPAKGRYTTTPDLLPLTTDFGNGHLDGCLFQLDEYTPAFLENKAEAINSHPERHVLFDDLDETTERSVCALIAERLTTEWPALFPDPEALARESFSALCLRFPEDIALVRRTGARGEWNAALHVCAPSHWRPEEKIGKGYADTHAPVPGIERQKAAAPSLVELFISRGPFVRFTWGISFDNRLNQHPDLPKSTFDSENLFLRVERQTLWPLPEVNAALFAIHLHLYSVRSLDFQQKELLLQALDSMSQQAREYKGIAGHFEAIQAAIGATMTHA
jgi:dimethylamine monooxygenase subunit A